jgi:tetratricopeptide (TPR) repeat protein
METPLSTPAATAAPVRFRDRQGRPYEPAVGPRLRILLAFIFATVAVLGATGIYLLAIRILEWINHPRIYQNFFSLWMVLVHIVVGVVLVLPFVIFGLAHLRTARHRPNRRAVRLGVTLFVTGLAVAVTGLALIRFSDVIKLDEGSLTRWVVLALHVVTPAAAVGIYVLHRRAGPEIRWSWGVSWAAGVASFVAAILYLHSQDPRQWYAKGSPEGEKYFEPSKARTVGAKGIPEAALMMDEYCLKCHADIYKSHIHSAHKFSSFNNPAYLFSVIETRKRMGTRAARWCAGCHDPVPFFSLQFDDENYDMINHPTAHAGITCTVCHAMTHVNSRSGNGDYTIEEPIHYPFAYSENPILQWLNNQLVKAKPDFHKKTFLKPFHRSEEFCSTCHKVGVPQEVNHYREFLRGQNHPDSYHLSGVSGIGTRSFYYPEIAKTRCAECHMPLEPSNDFGSQDFDRSGVRKVHNHTFLGANTAMPALLKYAGYEKVIAAHEKFLQGGIDGKSPALRIDLFGLKHLARPEQGVEAPLIDDRPLRPTLPRLKPGATYLVEVVIRTLNMGHHFTQGTTDSNEVWVDFTARSGGRVIGRSGAMDGGADQGRADENAHFLNVLMLDRHGNRIDRRNPQDIFTPLYDHQIPPGAAQVVHYRLQVPRDVTEAVELTARVRYRKFDYTYMEKVYGPGKVPKLPIVDLCSDRVVLPLAGGKQVTAQEPPIPPWQRWNDYGIGCFLEGGPTGKGGGELAQAERSFQRLLGPEFAQVKEAPAHGHLNLARVYLAQGRLDMARESLTRAGQCDPPAPWQTVAYFTGVLNLENTHFRKAISNFEQILDPQNRDPIRKFDFTKDYVVRDDLGKALFYRAQQEEGSTADRFLRRAVEQFEQVLELDAEDVVAHDFLNRCFARLGGEGRAPGRAEDTQLVELARSLAEVNQTPHQALEKAMKLARILGNESAAYEMPMLLDVRQRCQMVTTSSRDVRLRLAVGQALTQLDRLILAGLPALGTQLSDPRAGPGRLDAAALLDAALLQLSMKPAPIDGRPMLGVAPVWPVPGLPMNLTLDALATGGYLQGPLPPPRQLVVLALRQQVRPLFDQNDDADLQTTAARILARIHLILHGIFKPDENAQGHAIGVYRQRHPAADRASHAIVIYPLQP